MKSLLVLLTTTVLATQTFAQTTAPKINTAAIMQANGLNKTLALDTKSLNTKNFLAKVGGGQEGSGGGGVVRNGQVMTFYSAGVTIDGDGEKSQDQIPNLTELVKFVDSSGFFSETTAASLLRALVPSMDRTYYNVDPDHFDATLEERLKSEYSRITGQPMEQIVLFAVTDTAQKSTLLLPKFYQLTAAEQMAILFHEALWILNPKSSYQNIIRAEMAFQSYMQDQSNSEKAFRLASLVGTDEDLVKMAILKDIQNGQLKESGYINDNGHWVALSAELFMGNSLDLKEAYSTYGQDGPTLTDMARLQERFPRSLLVKVWLQLTLQHKAYFKTSDYFDFEKESLTYTSPMKIHRTPVGNAIAMCLGPDKRYHGGSGVFFAELKSKSDITIALGFCSTPGVEL